MKIRYKYDCMLCGNEIYKDSPDLDQAYCMECSLTIMLFEPEAPFMDKGIRDRIHKYMRCEWCHHRMLEENYRRYCSDRCTKEAGNFINGKKHLYKSMRYQAKLDIYPK